MTLLQNEMTHQNLPTGNFLPLDTNLINNEKYAELSCDAMFLHTLYTMRMNCSLYHDQKDHTWSDEEGRTFIYFSNEEAAKILRISERKVTTLRNLLIKHELIQVKRCGLKNYRIYVALPAAPQTDKVVLPHKNFITVKEKAIATPAETEKISASTPQTTPVDLRGADFAITEPQKLPTRTNKQLDLTKDTRATKATPSYPQDQQETLIKGLLARYQHLIPKRAFERFLPFCEGSYQKAKWFVDTLFKAKHASTQLFIAAGLPIESEFLTFEGNPYFTNGLADAVAKAMEQIHRYQTVQNPEGFFYAFMKGYFTEKTRQYVRDHYDCSTELAQIMQRATKKQLQIA